MIQILSVQITLRSSTETSQTFSQETFLFYPKNILENGKVRVMATQSYLRSEI